MDDEGILFCDLFLGLKGHSISSKGHNFLVFLHVSVFDIRLTTFIGTVKWIVNTFVIMISKTDNA